MLTSQTIKFILHTVVNHKIDINRLNGDGGMPSSHSSIVSSVATLSGLIYGLNSPVFALSFILAIIICHDAMHSRQEIGKQAVIINKIIKDLVDKEQSDKVLEEFVGHTPFQVLAGILLGVTIALMYFSINLG